MNEHAAARAPAVPPAEAGDDPMAGAFDALADALAGHEYEWVIWHVVQGLRAQGVTLGEDRDDDVTQPWRWMASVIETAGPGEPI